MNHFIEKPDNLMDTPKNQHFGIVIAGHGSRDPEGVEEFEQTMRLFKKHHPNRVITHGFLEFATPTIDEAIRENIENGSKRVVMVPGILFAASHGKNDMPIELLSMKKEFPNHHFHYGGAMEIHPSLLRLFQERIQEAEERSPRTVARSETLLVVVGRGTTDPDVNSNVYKLARMVEEGMGFGGSFVCFSGTAKPLVQEGLELAAKMEFSRIIVIPYFIFTGVLVKRIYEAVDQVNEKTPDVEILKAKYLGVHENVTDVWMERAIEAMEGKSAMDCSLCKYRVQLIGYEDEVGKVQEAHHHHVRGLHQRHHEHSHRHSRHEEPTVASTQNKYEPHPIEVKSFEIIRERFNWSSFPEAHQAVLQRLVHTSGDFSIVKDILISEKAISAGVGSLSHGDPIITDVTMVQSGLKRALLRQLGVQVHCYVHDEETAELASEQGLTRSAAGIRRAKEKHGNEVIVSIGDAPTAVMETVRLIQEEQWNPRLVIGFSVGFVGTRECKEALSRCQEVSRITNQGTKGGSPWAAATVNALMIQTVNQFANA